MDNNSTSPSSALPRRDFLKKTATAAAAVAATPLLRTPVYGQNQAPSAITKPSRSRENGREARCGSWFQRVDMMRIS